MSELPPIYWKTYVAAAIERVFETLTTAAGWDGWFTRGSTCDERELVMRWQDVQRARHRVTLWDGHDGEMRCPIITREPPTRFAFRWTTTDRTTTVDFTLTPRGDGTVVEVTEHGFTDADLAPAGGVMAARFHNLLVNTILAIAQRCNRLKVVLSGGCFQNRYLAERVTGQLFAAGFQPYWHPRVPPNDGGIALGQLWLATSPIRELT